MKKLLCLIIAFCLCLSFFGCRDGSAEQSPTSPNTPGNSTPEGSTPADLPPSSSPEASTPADSLPTSSPESTPVDIPTESSSETPPIPDESTEIGPPPCVDDEPPGKTEPMPDLLPNEYETITGDYSVMGVVIGKTAPNILLIRINDTSVIKSRENRVFVITDKASTVRLGSIITVEFKTIHRPIDTSQYVRVYAHFIRIVAAPEVPATKPILYFYSPTKIVCSAKVTVNGRLTCTYPEHGKEGWRNFTVRPDGMLVFPDGKEYYALYWEGQLNDGWDFSRGFCVRGEDTAAFLEWALSKLGLSPREANEFIIYWLPIMQENPYNVISFQTTAYTDGAVLEIDPAPDSLLRVFMAFYPSDTEVKIEPQTFAKFERKGFTVVEWGGSQVEKP